MNIITIVGNVGKIDQKDNFTKISVATTDGWGENQKTNWHNCMVFKKTKEFVDSYIQKGSKVAITGTISYKEYEGKWYTSILINNLENLTPRDNNKSNNNNNNYNNNNEEDMPF